MEILGTSHNAQSQVWSWPVDWKKYWKTDKKRKTEKLLKRFWGMWWLHRRSPQCSARKSFTLFIVVLSASRTYLWYFYCLFKKVVLHLEFMYDITRTANPQAIIWQGIWLIEQISRCLHSLDRLAATSFKVDLAKSVGRMFLKWVNQIRSGLIICDFFKDGDIPRVRRFFQSEKLIQEWENTPRVRK